jgi:hypothetical protein
MAASGDGRAPLGRYDAMAPSNRRLNWSILLLLACLLCGCASPQVRPARAFDFQQDTFAYENELMWEYQYDADGKWTTHPRVPKPDYSHHCFVLARAAVQFFYHARFDSNAPIADEATYRQLIRRVVSLNPRDKTPEAERIVIPGYANLREFTYAWEPLMKAECGGKWVSYVQRGHWRMIFPFSRKAQARMARQLQSELARQEPAVVHVVRFPQLTINHAMVVFDVREDEKQIEFIAYDPNQPAKPTVIIYERGSRRFVLPANYYFPGGRVDVYQVYHRWNY